MYCLVIRFYGTEFIWLSSFGHLLCHWLGDQEIACVETQTENQQGLTDDSNAVVVWLIWIMRLMQLMFMRRVFRSSTSLHSDHMHKACGFCWWIWCLIERELIAMPIVSVGRRSIAVKKMETFCLLSCLITWKPVSRYFLLVTSVIESIWCG